MLLRGHYLEYPMLLIGGQQLHYLRLQWSALNRITNDVESVIIRVSKQWVGGHLLEYNLVLKVVCQLLVGQDN